MNHADAAPANVWNFLVAVVTVCGPVLLAAVIGWLRARRVITQLRDENAGMRAEMSPVYQHLKTIAEMLSREADKVRQQLADERIKNADLKEENLNFRVENARLRQVEQERRAGKDT